VVAEVDATGPVLVVGSSSTGCVVAGRCPPDVAPLGVLVVIVD